MKNIIPAVASTNAVIAGELKLRMYNIKSVENAVVDIIKALF